MGKRNFDFIFGDESNHVSPKIEKFHKYAGEKLRVEIVNWFVEHQDQDPGKFLDEIAESYSINSGLLIIDKLKNPNILIWGHLKDNPEFATEIIDLYNKDFSSATSIDFSDENQTLPDKFLTFFNTQILQTKTEMGEQAEFGDFKLPIFKKEQFLKIKELEGGGMGDLSLVLDLKTHRLLVLKRNKSQENNIDFIKEAISLARLGEPNEAQALYKDEDDLILVQDYFPGVNLEEIKLSEDSVLEISLQILEQLQKIHSENIVFKDLKPANVMIALDTNSKELTVKLVDYGIVERGSGSLVSDTDGLGKVFEEHERERQIESRVGMGTLPFLPPESFILNKIDKNGDIYALGVMIYKLLVGSFPPKIKNATKNEYSYVSDILLPLTLSRGDNYNTQAFIVSKEDIKSELEQQTGVGEKNRGALAEIIYKAMYVSSKDESSQSPDYAKERYQSAEEMLEAIKEYIKNK